MHNSVLSTESAGFNTLLPVRIFHSALSIPPPPPAPLTPNIPPPPPPPPRSCEASSPTKVMSSLGCLARSRHALRAAKLWEHLRDTAVLSLQLRVLWQRDDSFGGQHRSELRSLSFWKFCLILASDTTLSFSLVFLGWIARWHHPPCRSLPFAPSWIAKGRLAVLDGDRTSGRAGGWPAVRGRSARSRWELKMRERAFLQGHVTVVAILFRSILTVHALFHMNEDHQSNARSYVKSPHPPLFPESKYGVHRQPIGQPN